MGSIPGVSLLLLAVMSLLKSPSVQGGKILVFPLDGSHWVNMNLLIQSLHARGHEVTVVRTSTSWYIKENAPHYHSITVTLPEAMSLQDQDFFVSLLFKMLTIQKEGASLIGFVKFFWEMLDVMSKIHRQASMFVVEILENKTLMQSIRPSV
ncbi:UDP-glucuronosyltransferase 1-2-like [Morone saxatilis]|uniref:UDP-glucuronosyltransferase 1-2-like n=1 Tax=Morone saxatilis TaxID=34816 RepID=UPI0015E23238|nr:UDP-glucuronosyltransferase 1-2-like [Morone saxatilis]